MTDAVVRRAEPAEYDQIIELANVVFEEDFAGLIPKLYKGHPEKARDHMVAERDGRMIALAAAFPVALNACGHALNLRVIGTVSVLPQARGQGLMGAMIARLVEDARREGCDMMCLGGRRQRYEYFGFGEASTDLCFEVEPWAVKHCAARARRKIELIALAERPDWTSKCLALHADQPCHSVRTEGEFLDVLRTWSSEGYALAHEGTFLGYASVSRARRNVQEMCLCEDEDALDAVLAIAAFCKEKVAFHPMPWQRGLLEALGEIADAAQARWADMILVLNYSRVIEAMLALRNTLSPLAEGRLVVEAQGAGRWAISVAAGAVRVTPTEDAPDISLPGPKLITRLFAPVLHPYGRPLPERDWFPLPVLFSEADMG